MQTEQARAFLSRAIDWSVAGTGAYANVHYTFVPKNVASVEGMRLPVAGIACVSLDEMIRTITSQANRPATRDIYFCTSLQSVAEEVRKDRAYLKAVRSAQNTKSSKMLFLDVDVKAGGKGYSSTEDALKAVGAFVVAAKLPKPNALVSSGSGGLHVYWILDTSLEGTRWQYLANALAAAAQKFSLLCDTQVTVDRARFLRVPGTVNFKSGTPKAVTLLGNRIGPDIPVTDIADALEPYAGGQVVMLRNDPFAGATPSSLLAGMADDSLSSGIERRNGKVILDSVAPNCEFIRNAIETGGADYGQPLWHLTTLISVFTSGGRDDAHRMAHGYVGDKRSYSPEETDEMFDRLSRDKITKNIGFPSCAKIELAGCSACSRCPLQGQGRSPLNFGVYESAAEETPPAATPAAPTQVTVVPDLIPAPYIRDRRGVVMRPVVLETGLTKHFPIIDYPLRKGWVEEDPWVLHFETEIRAGGRPVSAAISLEAIQGSKDALTKEASRFGIGIKSTEHKGLQEFLMSWFQQLQRSQSAANPHKPYGWAFEGGKRVGFALDGRLYTAQGTITAQEPTGEHVHTYRAAGEAEPWKKAVTKLVTARGNPALNALIGAMAGAPLIGMTGQRGALVSAVSQESGVGKSTTALIGLAIWASPRTGKQTLDDTENSVLKKAGTLSSIPLVWDEVRADVGPDAIRAWSKIVWRIAQGLEKSRLNQASVMQRRESWETMVITTSNMSLAALMAEASTGDTAGLYRIFEFDVPPSGNTATIMDAATLTGELDYNYGHVGVSLAQYWGANIDAVKQDIAAVNALFAKRTTFSTAERLWLSTMVCTVVGAIHLRRLGWVDLDIPKMIDFLVSVLSKLRNEADDSVANMELPNASRSVLAQLVSAARSEYLLITDTIPKIGSRGSAHISTPLTDVSRLKGIYMRLVRDERVLYISKLWATSYLQRARMRPDSVLRSFAKHLGATTTKRTLTAGVRLFTGSQEYVIEIRDRAVLDDLLSDLTP